jgi:hypothetical protein
MVLEYWLADSVKVRPRGAPCIEPRLRFGLPSCLERTLATTNGIEFINSLFAHDATLNSTTVDASEEAA